MKRRINIEVYDESLALDSAVRAVAKVIEGGRVSGDGKSFCYGTVCPTYTEGITVGILANVNKVREGGEYITSDTFKVTVEGVRT